MRRKLIFFIFMFLFLVSIIPSSSGRRIKGYKGSGVKIMFVPAVKDVSGFWMADITLFSVIAEILGVEADNDLIAGWIEFQQQEAQDSFEIIILLMDILDQVEEEDIENGFKIADIDGRIVTGIKNYFKTVCYYLDKNSSSILGDLLADEIINEFFNYSLIPELKMWIEDSYIKIFPQQ